MATQERSIGTAPSVLRRDQTSSMNTLSALCSPASQVPHGMATMKCASDGHRSLEPNETLACTMSGPCHFLAGLGLEYIFDTVFPTPSSSSCTAVALRVSARVVSLVTISLGALFAFFLLRVCFVGYEELHNGLGA